MRRLVLTTSIIGVAFCAVPPAAVASGSGPAVSPKAGASTTASTARVFLRIREAKRVIRVAPYYSFLLERTPNGPPDEHAVRRLRGVVSRQGAGLGALPPGSRFGHIARSGSKPLTGQGATPRAHDQREKT